MFSMPYVYSGLSGQLFSNYKFQTVFSIQVTSATDELTSYSGQPQGMRQHSHLERDRPVRLVRLGRSQAHRH